MKILVKIIVTLFMVLGLVHAGFTPVFFTELNEAALWFLGTGLGLFFLGMLNIGAVYAKYSPLIRFAIFCNFIVLAFAVLIVIVMPAIQSYIAVVLAFLMLLGSFWLLKNYDE